ncbi:uncharacterized protein BT62DRAFT_905534 [Guyanagaster necrorhizus]|uniref:C2H2-type domain-containing protein n=1 Tax=Guyanagaster necrorhizus TaxID=856835 RepID=A0A9P7VKU2_9AGAR|nr:uncharacterized protein BT62DRAFT_905534 [Guyanagaster necrorhizus MCA 3950]KAG7442554.1 hypothetical protein BT62DRAFT_905534 [Guyanagaster necrorhizus MCA 3950]
MRVRGSAPPKHIPYFPPPPPNRKRKASSSIHVPGSHTSSSSVSFRHGVKDGPSTPQHHSPHASDSTTVSSSGEGDDEADGESENTRLAHFPSSRKHVCTLCDKRFNRPSSLNIHVNSHTGAKPFPCPFPACGRAFNVNSNMRRHYRGHLDTNKGGSSQSRF